MSIALCLGLVVAVIGIAFFFVQLTESIKNFRLNKTLKIKMNSQSYKGNVPKECPECGKPLCPPCHVVMEGLWIPCIIQKFLEISQECYKPVHDTVDPNNPVTMGDGCGWKDSIVVPFNGYSWP